MKRIKVGTIELGKEVKLTDPCYLMDFWGNKTISTREGKYDCFFKTKDCGEWGIRVSHLIVKNADYKDIVASKEFKYFCVDSGQAGIFDLEYYKANRKETWYQRVCDITLREECGVIDNKCVVSSSGYGDGGYDCKIKYDKEGNAVYFELNFI